MQTPIPNSHKCSTPAPTASSQRHRTSESNPHQPSPQKPPLSNLSLSFSHSAYPSAMASPTQYPHQPIGAPNQYPHTPAGSPPPQQLGSGPPPTQAYGAGVPQQPAQSYLSGTSPPPQQPYIAGAPLMGSPGHEVNKGEYYGPPGQQQPHPQQLQQQHFNSQ